MTTWRGGAAFLYIIGEHEAGRHHHLRARGARTRGLPSRGNNVAISRYRGGMSAGEWHASSGFIDIRRNVHGMSSRRRAEVSDAGDIACRRPCTHEKQGPL